MCIDWAPSQNIFFLTLGGLQVEKPSKTKWDPVAQLILIDSFDRNGRPINGNVTECVIDRVVNPKLTHFQDRD